MCRLRLGAYVAGICIITVMFVYLGLDAILASKAGPSSLDNVAWLVR